MIEKKILKKIFGQIAHNIVIENFYIIIESIFTYTKLI